MIDEAVLTVNVIVFGVEEHALPGIVAGAWSRATGAETGLAALTFAIDAAVSARFRRRTPPGGPPGR